MPMTLRFRLTSEISRRRLRFDQQVTRVTGSSRSFSVCYLKGGELLAVEAVNHAKDYMAARALIPNRARPDLTKLGDATVTLRFTI